VTSIGRPGGGGRDECAGPVGPGLRVLPRSAASCHVTHRKLSGCLRASGFIRKCSQEFKKDVRGPSRGALRALARYDWPRNVRELESITVVCSTRPTPAEERQTGRVICPAQFGRAEQPSPATRLLLCHRFKSSGCELIGHCRFTHYISPSTRGVAVCRVESVGGNGARSACLRLLTLPPTAPARAAVAKRGFPALSSLRFASCLVIAMASLTPLRYLVLSRGAAHQCARERPGNSERERAPRRQAVSPPGVPSP
jgi:hypothetical protein